MTKAPFRIRHPMQGAGFLRTPSPGLRQASDPRLFYVTPPESKTGSQTGMSALLLGNRPHHVRKDPRSRDLWPRPRTLHHQRPRMIALRRERDNVVAAGEGDE